MLPHSLDSQSTAPRIVLFGAVALFAVLAVCVAAGAADDIDNAMRNAIHGIASPAVTAAARHVTMFGSTLVLVTLCAVASVTLLLLRRRTDAALLIGVLAATMLTNSLLKLVFERVRPDAYYGDVLSTFSFPSGHSAFACAFYGTLAVLLMPYIPSRPARVALVTGMSLLIGAIGLSRIYLGVHYPTDVAGGYLVAITCMAVVYAAGDRWFTASPGRNESASDGL